MLMNIRRNSASKMFHQIKKKNLKTCFLSLFAEDPKTGKRCHREKPGERTPVEKAVGRRVFLFAASHLFFPKSYHGIYHYHYD